MEKISEGKTKIIWQDSDNPDRVIIQFKDDITAGDGKKHEILEDNSKYSCETAKNCFQLLDRHFPGMSHFLSERDETSFYAKRMEMIPVEFIARRIASGSFLERSPRTREGKIFKKLVTECFLKDNERRDPLIVYKKGDCLFYDAHIEVCSSTIKGIISNLTTNNGKIIPIQMMSHLKKRSKEIFIVLEEAWKRLGVALVDLKVEFGFDFETYKVTLADDFTNGSWRIWVAGDKKRMLDKQLFRDGYDLKIVKEAFELVAKATSTPEFHGIKGPASTEILTMIKNWKVPS